MFAEYQRASGDAANGDGTHAIGWSNTQEGVGGVEWRMPRKWNGPAASSKRIGAEWDLRCTRRFSHLTLMAGVERFNGGPYWRQSRAASGTTYPFLVWTYAF